MALGDGSSWDETQPTNATLATQIDDYNRDLRIGVRARLALEHEWPVSQAATAEAGMHKFITLQNQATAPTLSGTQIAGVYTKTVGAGLQELFWKNEAGMEVQVTDRTVAGRLVKVQNFLTGTVVSSAQAVAYSMNATTAPTGTSGVLVMSTTYTPLSTSNVLFISVQAQVDVGAGSRNFAFLHIGTDAAIRGVATIQGGTNELHDLKFEHYMSVTTTGAIVFNVRAGGDSTETITLNGINGSTRMGGILASGITIMELKP